MRLLDYMREEGLDDEAFAERLGECGPYAVKKWKYGEREPDASTIVRIERATGGGVALRDWAEQAAERKAKRTGISASDAPSSGTGDAPQNGSRSRPTREVPREIPCRDFVGVSDGEATEAA